MPELADQSVHLVVTSPPYWQLKDYGNAGQIGFDDSYEDYINNLNLVWRECHRVLHQGCRLCVNIGDQFARSVYYGRYKIIPIRTEIIKFCEAIGFDYMGAIIWQKVTTCNTTGGATVMGSYPYPRNGILKLDYEFILIFKKQGTAPRVTKELKERSKLTKDEWNEYFSGHWNFSGEKQEKHLAMFPEELPRRLIKMFTFIGDTVLDPFLGSGTTSLAALNLGRSSIGYEINAEFRSLIQRKLGVDQSSLFSGTTVNVIQQGPRKVDFDKEILTLPYIFKDVVKIDKKVDPRKLRFGSKITASDANRETYYSVKKIPTGETIILDSGQTVRLLGVKCRQDQSLKAIEFLREKTRGQKVFLRFDNVKHDSKHNLLGYVYLENKTFLNAHLIKQGLADADTSLDYRHKAKFLAEKGNR